jgi:hypothetical protein
MSSSALLVLMVFSGIVAVAANAYYPVMKAQEAKLSLAKSARDILTPEVAHNLQVLSGFKDLLAKDSIPFVGFDVSAWETVSKRWTASRPRVG